MIKRSCEGFARFNGLRIIVSSSINAVFGKRNIDALHLRLCQLVSWFTLFYGTTNFFNCCTDNGFILVGIAMQESLNVYACHGFFYWVAAQYLAVNEHVRVELFYRPLLVRKNKALVDMLAHLVLFNAGKLFLFYGHELGLCPALLGSVYQPPQTGSGLPPCFPALKRQLILLFCITMNLARFWLRVVA